MSTERLISFIQDYYKTTEFIPLHAPQFEGNERKYVLDTLDSTFVSTVGAYVDRFEKQVADYTKAKYAVATVNGTAALHIALLLAGVKMGDLVITQALTFVATCNAISYLGAEPVFVDVNIETLGLCPIALLEFLDQECVVREQACFHKSGKRIRAVVVMHTFGHPAKVDELLSTCKKYFIELIEDAAESLGSLYKDQHTGTFAKTSALSFNGNKVITTGGGGMILSREKSIADKAKHVTTTAKQPHPYEFYHDEIAFNYRMPNINAALGCAQLEQLNDYIENKRMLASLYQSELIASELEFIVEPKGARSNYWLNAVICPSKKYRDEMLTKTNQAGVMTRPVWQLIHTLPMFKDSLRGNLDNSIYLADRLVNMPSSVSLT
ncbi:LegC family aminotransferase [Pseudoalteromonas shioyasakiensis]|uniref:LegC family aminotransferase n=1 Tax=Pseudoalteromonas shioyasakiensis TaxID=1190813 RepID=UPI002118D1DB|nr:LegC family aminotransferase [Pseudoalteromonas shioyasakiensis]MCQ8877375.1 LegC family aminotransferase [Pseudoalteromonas shioyasakiensis]